MGRGGVVAVGDETGPIIIGVEMAETPLGYYFFVRISWVCFVI